MILPGLAVIAAFVAGLFIDERTKQAVIPLPPWVQIVGAAVIMGLIGGTVAYYSDDVRGVALLGTTVLWALVAPALHLGNVVRDRISPNWRR